MMEEDQGSHHHFLAHFQAPIYHVALIKAEDIMPGHTLCKTGEGLAQRQRTRPACQRSCPNHFPLYQFQSSLVTVVRILQVSTNAILLGLSKRRSSFSNAGSKRLCSSLLRVSTLASRSPSTQSRL